MRPVLIIETSTDTASIALAIDGEIAAEKSFCSDRRHNALLFQPLAEIIAEPGRQAFDAVFVGSGPGSYSGTRVGIAAAQGAALVAGCKAIAIPSILATPEALTGANCLACGDARRGSYWTAQIANGAVISDPEITDASGFDAEVSAARKMGITIFSMETIKGKDVHVTRPSASGLWKVWQNASAETRALWIAHPPQPIYLAPPHITPSKKEVFR